MDHHLNDSSSYMCTATYICISCHYDLIVLIDVNIMALTCNLVTFSNVLLHNVLVENAICTKFNFLICIGFLPLEGRVSWFLAFDVLTLTLMIRLCQVI